MIFWIGFTVMVLNEGFVIMRHVHPWFAQRREALMAKYGSNWKRFHAFFDYVWIGGVSLGILLDFANWKFYATVLGVFWGIVAVSVYLPLLIKKLRKPKKLEPLVLKDEIKGEENLDRPEPTRYKTWESKGREIDF